MANCPVHGQCPTIRTCYSMLGMCADRPFWPAWRSDLGHARSSRSFERQPNLLEEMNAEISQGYKTNQWHLGEGVYDLWRWAHKILGRPLL